MVVGFDMRLDLLWGWGWAGFFGFGFVVVVDLAEFWYD